MFLAKRLIDFVKMRSIFPAPHGTPALTVVAVHTDEFHVRIIIDEFLVVSALDFKGAVLRVACGADPAVGSRAQFLSFHAVSS